MKIEIKFIKAGLALLLALGFIVWSFTSLQSRAYTGEQLDFTVSAGTISVTNQSEQVISAQLTSMGTRAFRVTSSNQSLAGSSVRLEVGSVRSQLFELALPSGESAFSVSAGSAVNFIAASANNQLLVTVAPMSEGSSRVLLIVTSLVVVASLFYASQVTEHQWLMRLRGAKPMPVVAETPIDKPDGGQGRVMRSYGDNRHQ